MNCEQKKKKSKQISSYVASQRKVGLWPEFWFPTEKLLELELSPELSPELGPELAPELVTELVTELAPELGLTNVRINKMRIKFCEFLNNKI